MPCSSEVKQFVNGFYTYAASLCAGLDVRILLSNISNTSDLELKQHALNRKYHVSLLDCVSEQDVNVLLNYIKQIFPQENNDVSIVKVLQESLQTDLGKSESPDAVQGMRVYLENFAHFVQV